MSHRSAAPAAEKNGRPLSPVYTTPHAVTMTVTPELAVEWLNANTMNRPIRESQVYGYARDMREGRWRLNGHTIKWSKDGRLLDGQHRLYACIEANTPFETDVRFGLDEDVFATLDRGGIRTAGDNLALLGEVNSNILAAAVKKLVNLKDGVLFHYGASSRVTPEQVIEALRRDPDIRLSVPSYRGVGKLAPPSLVVFLHYLFAQRDRALADWFMNALGSGLGLSATYGVYHLRKRLEANVAAKAKLPEKEIAALFIKAWNAHRADRRLKALRWRNTGEKPEPFPEIR